MRRVIFPQRMAWIFALLVCFAVAGARPAAAWDERELLSLMASGRHVNYAGEQSIEVRLGSRRAHGNVQVSQFNGCIRTEIISPGRLRGMVTLERGQHRAVRRPGDPRWQIRPGGTGPIFHKILNNYTLRQGGSDNVAGYRAVAVQIRSRYGGKLARKMWMDPSTGVVLRTELYNWAGQLVYIAAFRQIDYTPRLDPGDFRMPGPPRRDGCKPPPPPVNGNVDLPQPGYLPRGYELMGRPRWMHTERGPAAHLRYADGLNGISVFVRKLQPGEGSNAPGPAQHVMDQPFVSVIHYVKGDYRVTLIGDVSPRELQRMAGSIR